MNMDGIGSRLRCENGRSRDAESLPLLYLSAAMADRASSSWRNTFAQLQKMEEQLIGYLLARNHSLLPPPFDIPIFVSLAVAIMA
ncbi:hypothetical protein NL676_021511 [Syzygium grande]|nr:hypothetical protein NL676_021511 [Syzygium grande]